MTTLKLLCEMLCTKYDNEDDAMDAYIMGMLSLIDAILNRPLEEIIQELYVPPKVNDALMGKYNCYTYKH